MTTDALVTEVTRYLETVDLFRLLELDVTWRSEADEVRLIAETLSEPGCRRCASPFVRINGRHVCLGVR